MKNLNQLIKVNSTNFSISQEVKSTLRSLYRLTELKNLNSPEFIIESEITLIKKRMDILSKDEIIMMMLMFENYRIDEKKNDIIQDKMFFEDLSRELNRLN